MYRAAIQPSRAFGQTLESFMSRLRDLDRRTRWNSATTPLFPADQTLAPSPTPIDIVSITVDPGRWMFLGGMNVVHVSSIGPIGWSIHVRLEGLSTTVLSATSGEGLSGDPLITSMNVIATEVFAEQAEVTLTCRWLSYDAPYGGATFDVNDIYLIAAPA